MDRRVKNENGTWMRNNHDDTRCDLPDGSTTLLQVLQNLARRRPTEPFLGSVINNKVLYKTYGEILQLANKLASFFEKITNEGDIIGLYSVNRVEWIVAEYASYLASCTNCPIFSTFSPDALECILSETELKVLVASAEKARSLLKAVLSKSTNAVKHIVLMDDDKELIADLKNVGITAYTYNSIIKNERGHPQRKEPTADDIATICYTSGTSGKPKGVILTHKNFLSVISGFLRCEDITDIIRFGSSDVYISYLPLPHVLERICFSIIFAYGVKVVFYRGNARLLQEDCKIIKPSFIVVVPRVLNVFKEKIMANVAKRGFMVRVLFNIGLWYKKMLQKWCIYKSWFFDKLIFNKVAAEFGGRLSHCLCGGASLNPEVLQFIEATMSMKIFQGYGQTEALAADIIMPLDINDDESVGIPFPGIQAKIDLLPEYGEGKGELWLRGSHITKGYFKRPEETKSTITEDGWLKTGDIASVKNGRFYIVGRVKEVFKTSFGEYVVPEMVENYFVGGLIEDIFITNTRFSDFLVAIVVNTNTSVSEDEIKEVVKARAKELLDNRKIMRYEVPEHVILIHESFMSYADGSLMTPSLKKRRKHIQEYFHSLIEEEASR